MVAALDTAGYTATAATVRPYGPGMPSMRASGGWRVEPLTLERGGRTLQRYRVSRHGVYVGEVPITTDPARDLALIAALGVPVDQLAEDEGAT